MNQLKKKTSLYFFVSLTCFSWASSLCFALPSEPVAQSGTVEIEYPNSHTMVIKSSDGAILHYKDFQIGAKEEVRFVQSTSSKVQHRIIGKNPSQILGCIQSNGNVVFVSPNGIDFGSDSKVDTRSLLVSTLDISNKNFLKQTYRFTAPKGENSSIVVEGSLRSEGSITLLAPHIRNLGSIEACDVSLGSGKSVTLDESNLSVSESLKEGLIEQLGDVKAATVSIKLPLDKKAIVHIGEPRELVIEENGVVVFGSSSQMKAQKIEIEGSQISVHGSIDATNLLNKGGSVHLLGKDISLEGAKIDSSGLLGGGEVLIGGEFRGKGTTPYASKIFMDEASTIIANGSEASGGLVVLWSQDRTVFEGKIFAQSSATEGVGGLVETSSQGKLEVVKGKVDTFGSKEMGEWLLDPKFVKIVESGSSSCDYSSGKYGSCDNDSSCTIPVSAFKDLTTSLKLTGYCGVIVTTDFNVTTRSGYAKANLTFAQCSSGASYSCRIEFPGGGSVDSSYGVVQVYKGDHGTDTVTMTTDGGDLTFTPYPGEVWTKCPIVIDTTKNGASGGNITMPDVNCDKGVNLSLTMTAGTTGTITVSTAGGGGWGEMYLTNMVINSAKCVTASRINLLGAFTCHAPLCISSGSLAINTATKVYDSSDYKVGGNIIIDSVEGPGSLSCNAGSKYSITLGTVGASVPVSSFNSASFSGESLTVSSNISTSSGALSITTPVTIEGNSVALTTQGGSITLGVTPTYSSAKSLTLSAGSGSITVPSLGSSFQSISLSCGSGTIGGSSFTSSIISGLLTVSSLIEGGSVSLTATSQKALTTNGKMSFATDSTIGGTFISSGSITAAGSLIVGKAASLQALDGGITVGAQISNTAGAQYDLTLDASTSPISIGGDVTNLNSFTISSASEASLYRIITLGGAINIASPVVVKAGGGNITSSGGNVTLSKSIVPSDPNDQSIDLIIYALSSDSKVKGTISLQGMGDESHSFGTISLTGGAITLSQDSSIFAGETVSFSGDLSLASSISTSGSLNFSGTMNITGNTTLQGSSGINISSSITSSVASPSLTLDAGNNPLTIPSLGSSANPFGALSIKASSLTLGGDLYSSSSIKIDSPITISTDTKITSAGVGGLILTKPLTLAKGSVAPALTLDATSAGAVDVNSLGTDTAPLGAVSLSGNHVYLSGNIASSASIAISGPVMLFASSTLRGDTGISLDQDLSPNAGSMDLALKASSGTVSLKNLGTDTSPLQNISIVSAGPIKPGNLICSGGVELSGTTITLGSNVTASSYVKITNTDLLTISSGTLNLTGDFTQSGTGDVSLAASITTPGSISFAGALTITGDTTLKGSTGITITGSISPQSNTPNLTLDAGTTPLTVNFLSSETNSFGSVTVSASNLILEGDVYASSAIKINPPITISANTTLNSLEGTGGITLLKAVTAADGSGAPTLSLYAVEGAADVNRLGSDAAPLGAISLIGNSVYLSGNVTSVASLKITGPIYLLNDSSISLRGDTDITLDNSLIPNAGLCDLLMQSTGTVHVKDLGNNSYPLDEVSLTGSSIDLQGTITANSLEINGSSCTSGTCSSQTCPPWTYNSTSCSLAEQ